MSIILGIVPYRKRISQPRAALYKGRAKIRNLRSLAQMCDAHLCANITVTAILVEMIFGLKLIQFQYYRTQFFREDGTEYLVLGRCDTFNMHSSCQYWVLERRSAH